MNKICISLLICLSISFLPKTLATSEDNLVLHEKFPSKPQSCPPLEGYGYFWDGQKCEVCMPNCKCDSYLGCVECAEGYGRLFHKHHSNREPEAACYRCEEGRVDGDSFTETNIKSCCFQRSEVTQHTDITGEFRSYKVSALRALSCIEKDQKGSKVVQFGSYCFSVEYCEAYTEYGRCKQCSEGYYLKEESGNNQCVKCGYSAENDDDNKDADYDIKNCAICSSSRTCDQCEPGYYNPTYNYEKKNNASKEKLAKLLKNPFLCEECSQYNCECDESNKCTKCKTQTGHYYDNQSKSCKLCKVTNCKECDANGCSACKSGFQLNGGKCQAIASHCSQQGSKIDDQGKAKCSDTFCENGYYFKADTETCEKCNDVSWARCTVKDDNVVPTQCRQDTATHQPGSKGYQWVKERLPIDVNNYYLIEKDGNKYCKQNNELKCKEMKTKIADDKEPTCVSCYEDFGFFLNKKTEHCQECSKQISFCAECGYDEDDLVCKACFQKRDYDKSPSDSTEIKNYHAVDGKCEECGEGCLVCTKESSCTKCQKGYTLKNNSCERCSDDECQSCSQDQNICTQCFPGYRLWKSKSYTAPKDTDQNFSKYSNLLKCEQCEPKCLQCDEDRKFCTKCEEGHYLFNGICRPVRINCAEHQADGACKHCLYGFRNVQGYCFDCKTAGYINCPVGCSSTQSYVRDGDKLTQEFYEKRMEDLYRPISGSLLQFISAAFILIASLLI